MLPEVALESRAEVLAGQLALVEEAIPSEWWALFRDDTLSRLQEQAVASNLDLLAAAARMDASRAQLGLADAARRPQLSGQAAYSRSANSENSPMAALGAPTEGTDSWSMGLQTGWEIDLWGHLRYLSESAESRLVAAGYGMDAVQVSVAGDVARTYLLLRGTQAQQTIVEENHQIAESLVRLAESRLHNGVATRYEAAAARADLAGQMKVPVEFGIIGE